MDIKNKKSGFTLIELMVVVAIVSLLSALVVTALNSARAKGRDAQRVSSIKQVQNALELYYSDNKGYPAVSGRNNPLDAIIPIDPFNYSIGNSLIPTYIKQMPVDPTAGVGAYRYFVFSTGVLTDFYSIMIPYETKTSCLVCGGGTDGPLTCGPALTVGGYNMCQ